MVKRIGADNGVERVIRMRKTEKWFPETDERYAAAGGLRRGLFQHLPGGIDSDNLRPAGQKAFREIACSRPDIQNPAAGFGTGNFDNAVEYFIVTGIDRIIRDQPFLIGLRPLVEVPCLFFRHS
jgi:hypothetical protein